MLEMMWRTTVLDIESTLRPARGWAVVAELPPPPPLNGLLPCRWLSDAVLPGSSQFQPYFQLFNSFRPVWTLSCHHSLNWDDTNKIYFFSEQTLSQMMVELWTSFLAVGH